MEIFLDTCHQPWPWPHSPLADKWRAARIAVLVGGGCVVVGGWSPEAGQWAVEGRATGAGAGAGAAVQRTRKDRVTGSRSWNSLTTTTRTLSWSFMRLWPWCWRRWRIFWVNPWRISAQVLELALCQVHRPVSEPLLELRAPLVRHLLQVAEPAPRPSL